MASLLISGPAGAGKSALAAEELADRRGAGTPAVLVDFQTIYAALTGAVRGPDGRYPDRDNALLPVAEYVRRAAINGARDRDLDVVATNSDGDVGRRTFLLSLLAAGATERVVDPGENVVAARLADPQTGALSQECRGAIDRWYDRL